MKKTLAICLLLLGFGAFLPKAQAIQFVPQSSTIYSGSTDWVDNWDGTGKGTWHHSASVTIQMGQIIMICSSYDYVAGRCSLGNYYYFGEDDNYLVDAAAVVFGGTAYSPTYPLQNYLSFTFTETSTCQMWCQIKAWATGVFYVAGALFEEVNELRRSSTQKQSVVGRGIVHPQSRGRLGSKLVLTENCV